jgi:hypothetical protein
MWLSHHTRIMLASDVGVGQDKSGQWGMRPGVRATVTSMRLPNCTRTDGHGNQRIHNPGVLRPMSHRCRTKRRLRFTLVEHAANAVTVGLVNLDEAILEG